MTCRKFHTLTSHGSLMALICKVTMANPVLYLLLQLLLMSASKAASLPVAASAQHAELHALIQACALAKCKPASVYADSRHAFRLANDVRILWKQCNFLTSGGNRIKNVPMFKELLDAILAVLAIIKILGHSNSALWKLRGLTFWHFHKECCP